MANSGTSHGGSLSRLDPCAHCSRHIRNTETTCTFCGGAVVRATPTEPEARRVAFDPTGLKRATLFALGASVASACGADNGQAIYGAPVPPDTSSYGVTESHDAQSSPEPQSSGALASTERSAPSVTSGASGDGTPSASLDAGLASLPDADAGPSADSGVLEDAGEVEGGTATSDTLGEGLTLIVTPPDDPEPTPLPIYGAPPAPR